MQKRIQVSFQGGGAKLIELLAAAEAMQETTKEKGFEISRVSGTSAGSIAATLIAFDKRVSQIDSSSIQPLISKVGESAGIRYLKDESLWSKASKLSDVFFGESIVEPDFLPGMIRGLLEKFDIDPDTPVRDVPKPIFITASSMVERKAIFFTQEHEKFNTVTIGDALTASCNIPLVFSSFNEDRDWRTAYVDGGLCENLPGEPLLSGKENHGQVLAFCVTSDTSTWPPKSAKQYLGHLFDIAINNSVERAKNQIGYENVHVVVSARKSLEFDKMPAHFRGESSYKRNRAACESWLATRLEALQKDIDTLSQEIPSIPTVDDLMEQNGRALMRRLLNKEFTLEYSAMIAKPYYLNRRRNSSRKISTDRDVLTKAHLIPRQKGFSLLEYPIGVAGIASRHATVPTILNVEVVTKDGDRRPIGFDLTLYKWTGEVFGTPRAMKKCIVTLHEPLKPAEEELSPGEPDKLFIWYEQDTDCLFRDLEDPDEEFDTLGLQGPSNAKGQIDNVYLAICGVDYNAAGVDVRTDDKSVPLRKLSNPAELPSELAFLFDPGPTFNCWVANTVTTGLGARLRLTNKDRLKTE